MADPTQQCTEVHPDYNTQCLRDLDHLGTHDDVIVSHLSEAQELYARSPDPFKPDPEEVKRMFYRHWKGT